MENLDFDYLLNNKNTHKFFKHILYSYSNPEKILFIWDWTANRYPNKYCALSRIEVLSIKEIRTVASKKFQHGEVFDWLSESLKFNSEVYETKQLAIASFESRTLLAYSTYIQLNNWIQDKRKSDNFFDKLFEEVNAESIS